MRVLDTWGLGLRSRQNKGAFLGLEPGWCCSGLRRLGKVRGMNFVWKRRG